MSEISTNIEVTPTRFQHIQDGRTPEYFLERKCFADFSPTPPL